MSKLHKTFLALLLLTLTPAVQAQLPDRALEDGGELHRLLAGSYGALFPGHDDLDGGTPVLVLEIADPAGGGDRVRRLVPGTGNARVESHPLLLHEPRTATTLLLWRSAVAHSQRFRLHFASWDGEWSEVRSVDGGQGNSFSEPLLLAHTRDAFDLEVAEGKSWKVSRIVVHVLFRDAEGTARYLPLIFVNGAYVGWHESLDLGTSFFQLPEGDSPAELTPGLESALGLEPADDGRSVVTTFANRDSGRIGALGIRILPLRLEALGDYVREQILSNDDLYDPGDMSSLADKIRAEIIFIGHRIDLHPGIVDFVSERVGEFVDESGGSYGLGDLDSLGEDARDLAIELTTSVSVHLVEDPANPDEPILDLEIGGLLDLLGGSSPLAKIVDARVLCDRPAPEIGDGITAIFPSRDGGDLLVGWKAASDSRIHYVESHGNRQDGSWSEPRTLMIGDGLSLEQAIELLQRKIR